MTLIIKKSKQCHSARWLKTFKSKTSEKLINHSIRVISFLCIILHNNIKYFCNLYDLLMSLNEDRIAVTTNMDAIKPK